MDYHFNEENLIKQLQISKCGIVTDKPINLEILERYRPNIAHLIYQIEEHDNPKFISHARKLGINVMLVSRLPDEKISDKKINYYDVARINHIEEPEEELVAKLEKLDNLFYKSNKVIMSERQTFSSFPKYQKGTPSMGNFEAVECSEGFFDDLDHFHIVKMLD